MAGKEGAAGERLEAVVEALGVALLREARVLAELTPSPDAPAAEKVAKAAKAIADAGRSLAALSAAAAPAPESSAADTHAQDAGTDMDDEHAQWDAADIARRRERLVERFAFGPLGADGAAAGVGGAGYGDDVGALALSVAPRPAPA